uniref:Uncharacterized protein n=1 Tax=Oryza glumipatula TaxID=40148 RepID=A0A0E0A0U7_9ORYZ
MDAPWFNLNADVLRLVHKRLPCLVDRRRMARIEQAKWDCIRVMVEIINVLITSSIHLWRVNGHVRGHVMPAGESERLGFLSVLPLLYAHNPSSNCHQQTSMQAAARQQAQEEMLSKEQRSKLQA